MGVFRSLYFDTKHLMEELALFVKYPTRKATRRDIKQYFGSICNTIIFHPWYCLKRGIRNLYKWFPIIWNNDCWDYFFLCDMMDKQLKEMEDFWVKKAKEERNKWGKTNEKGWRCQYRRIWKRIRWTRKLMEMWREEYYTMKWYDYHHSKFPERSFLEKNESLTKYDEYGVPILYTCKPMPEDERKHYRSGSDKAREMDEKVFKLWYNNLRFIRHWWY